MQRLNSDAPPLGAAVEVVTNGTDPSIAPIIKKPILRMAISPPAVAPV
jgi:hypothetical protein